MSDGVLFRALARGDANLVLRNILLRLWKTPGWDPFLSDLRQVFPELDIKVDFHEKTDEFIDVKIRSTAEWVPLEVAGTGVLQATQILSYIHRFSPPVIVLDEPDSHLHPNNQRLLCALLRLVAEERNTQVILTTHSRHVVDSIGGATGFFWIRDGHVDVAGPDDEIGILLEIGALDVKERVGQQGTKVVVLTEDELTKALELILTCSGFNLEACVVLPYYGITTAKNLRPLVKMIQGTNPNAKIIVHRDRDFLTLAEAEDWKTEVRKLGVEPFITKGRDIESYFINAKYLAEANPDRTETEFDKLIDSVLKSMQPAVVKDYVNGRIDFLRKAMKGSTIDPGTIAVEANKAVEKDLLRYCGKTALRAIRIAYQNEYHANLSTSGEGQGLRDPDLTVIAKKLFKSS